jgi:hypothetical protein
MLPLAGIEASLFPRNKYFGFMADTVLSCKIAASACWFRHGTNLSLNRSMVKNQVVEN